MRILLLGMVFVSTNIMAQWSTVINKDEMRKSETKITESFISPIDSNGPKLHVSIIEKPEERIYIAPIFSLDDKSRIECNDTCSISVRFDDYSVINEQFVPNGSEYIIPSKPVAFVRSMSLSKYVYVEIPVKGNMKYQYKIDTSDINRDIPSKPALTIFGLKLGADKSTLPTDATLDNKTNCYKLHDIALAPNLFKVKEATVCLAKERIALFLFQVTNKTHQKTLNKYLDNAYGSSDNIPKGLTTQWPDNKYVLDDNTSSTSILGKTYIISDSISEHFTQK